MLPLLCEDQQKPFEILVEYDQIEYYLRIYLFMILSYLFINTMSLHILDIIHVLHL